jgi:hypothetical protein
VSSKFVGVGGCGCGALTARPNTIGDEDDNNNGAVLILIKLGCWGIINDTGDGVGDAALVEYVEKAKIGANFFFPFADPREFLTLLFFSLSGTKVDGGAAKLLWSSSLVLGASVGVIIPEALGG